MSFDHKDEERAGIAVAVVVIAVVLCLLKGCGVIH